MKIVTAIVIATPVVAIIAAASLPPETPAEARARIVREHIRHYDHEARWCWNTVPINAPRCAALDAALQAWKAQK